MNVSRHIFWTMMGFSMALYLTRMNRNQRGCSIVIRGHDSRGCYGRWTCGTLLRPDWRRFVLLRPGWLHRDASHPLLRREGDPGPLRQPDPYFRLRGVCLDAARPGARGGGIAGR